ncbi:phosphatidylserine/phosphatidylglycerophosphate/cardiolipin synthase family protein [uncultured Sphingomonas sp.]|uniref:phospholipase D-like domain-containing protein n=1 Tax=uncultured Sphingomonas sp. TaxID=158754 RepID=UPI0035CB36B1
MNAVAPSPTATPADPSATDEPPAQPRFAVGDDRLTLLDTGPRRFAAMLDLIGNAKRSLRLLYYIYADDASGRRINEALIAAAGRGVTVSVVVDGFGCEVPSEFFSPLREAGASVCRFEPRWGRRFLLRNHQKLALADAEDADADGVRARIIIGGFNVADDYFETEADEAWRDLGLLVEGPTAARLRAYFDALDKWVNDPRPLLRDLNRALKRWSETEGRTRWLIGGPTRRLSPWARAVRADMRHARRIDMVAGYFTPSPTMLRHLDRAGRRGREVRIVTAATSDNTATVAAARFTYAGLLRKGVRIFEYQRAKLHTKLYAIDDTVHLGSANFDMRSLFINLELMLRIDDPAFARHVRGYIDGEIAASEAITVESHRARTGPITRVRQFLAYLMVGVVDPGVSRGINL